MELTNEDKEWMIKAIDKGHTRLEIKKKLEEAKYTEKRINLFLNYYDEIIRPEETITEDKEFKENVKEYLKGNKEGLGWLEKREIKKFIKNIETYKKVLKSATDAFKKELEEFNKKDWTKGKVDTELEYLKQEIIERLIDSKQCLIIEHPKTGAEITKENLQDLTIEELINMMEENTEELDLIVNGKITE